MIKKNWIVVTEFNEWVGTCTKMTFEEVREELKEIRQCLIDDGKPADTELIVYETVGESVSYKS